MVLMVATVVALCLALSVAVGAMPLDHNISNWVQPPNEPARWWNRDFLDAAVAVPGYRNLRPLLTKLNSGQNVTVVAFGTSITSDQGGCFSPELVAGLVAVPAHVHMSGKCAHTGYLTRFMQHINHTWPSSGHVVVNLGIPGSRLHSRAVGNCLEVTLPKTADLIIIENLAGIDGGGSDSATHLELLLTRLAHYFVTPPPIIILHTLHVTIPWSQADTCVRSQNCTACASFFEHNITASGGFRHSAEGILNLVAEYYGLSSISLRNFYYSYLRDAAPSDLTTTVHQWFCQQLGTVAADSVHVRLPLGAQLVADLMFNLLAATESHSSSSYSNQLPLRYPEAPLYPGGHDTYIFRCYGHNEDHTSMGTETIAPMKTPITQGWQWVDYQLHGTTKKFKPGWVATAPGAVLQMVVNTSFSTQHKPIVGLAYLLSYEHMGKANITCLGGCECAPMTVNAHFTEQNVSLTHAMEFGVSQAPECIVQVSTLNETSSGEHKFKVVRIYVKAAMGPLRGH